MTLTGPILLKVILMTDFLFWVLTWVQANLDLIVLILITLLLLTLTSHSQLRRRAIYFLRNYYVQIVWTVGILILALGFKFYLWDIIRSVAGMVDLLRAEPGKEPPATEDIRNLAYAVAVLLGVLVVAKKSSFGLIKLWINERSTKASERTTDAAEQGLITDRITQAVAGLGADKTIKITGGDGTSIEGTEPNLEVRIGSIYALERIAQDSDRDHIPVMQILCAYIRTNAPFEAKSLPKFNETDTEIQKVSNNLSVTTFEMELLMCAGLVSGLKDFDNFNKYELQVLLSSIKPRADIQTAITVIGRRTDTQLKLAREKEYRLELYNVNLHGANFQNCNFDHADFTECLLAYTKCQKASFRYSVFVSANFYRASDLETAKFCFSAAVNPIFAGTNMSLDNLKMMFIDATTEIPESYERPTHWPKAKLRRKEFFDEYEKWRDNSAG